LWPTNRPTLLLSIVGALLTIAQPGRAQQEGTPLVVVDVPFLAQTPDLCGGAAAAMVLRYWGQEDVQSGDFAALVDRTQRGISTLALVGALESRGAIVRPIHAEATDARHEVAAGRPVIALIDGGEGRLHYVVIVAWARDRVLFHDPSVGPYKIATEADFLRRWKSTGGFALVVTPGNLTSKPPLAASPTQWTSRVSACDSMVDRAIEASRGSDLEAGVSGLTAALELCPGDARAPGALAGVRFRQKRWAEASAFARQAIDRDPEDPGHSSLLGASLFLADEPRAALLAWNRIGEPRLDRVLIQGLERTRQDIATAIVNLQPRDVLTPESVARTERRLEQMPTASGGKVTYRPLAGGRVDALVSVGESALMEPWRKLGLRIGVEMVAKRESWIRFNSPTGRGEGLEIGGRFASRRPSAWVSLETPRLVDLPGVVSLRALWDRQTYRWIDGATTSVIVGTRRRGALDWSHWLTSVTRLDLGVAIERFDGRGTYGSIRAGAERRMAADRLALLAEAGSWTGRRVAKGFAEFGGTVAFRSRVSPRKVTVFARASARRATDKAPLALWPSAGNGAGRAFLLRSVRLVNNGEVVGAAFGRGLLQGTAEVEVQVADRGLMRLGVAAFVDGAKVWDSSLRPGSAKALLAIGAGLRIRASASTFRLDVAKRPGEPGLAFSAGVIPPWPR